MCLDWVLFWLSCREANSLNNGRNPSKWGEALLLTSLPDPSRSHISSPFICPLFPFSFSDSNYPLAKKHPMTLVSPSAIYKEQPVAFILINIYMRLRQTRSNPVRLSCERLIYVCFFCRSCSPPFLWKTLYSSKLVKSGLNGSPAMLLGDRWREAQLANGHCGQDARCYHVLPAALGNPPAHPGPCKN